LADNKKRNGGEWTDARFRSFVTSALRAASRRWPPKFKALKEAFVGRKTNKKTGKLAMHYKCAKCKKHFVATDVQVDHVLPVVDPKVGFIGWDSFIDRIFCEIENLQVLCKPCHKVKTEEEKAERKKK
jgi:5-methylcytosine-specific restriction endonuclease McrA